MRCRYAVCRELCRNPAPLFRRSADAQCFAALPQTSSQLRCRRVRRSPPQVQNQHPAENAARRAQGLALRAPGRFRRRAEAASAGCHARAMQQRHTPRTLRASPRRGSDGKESATLYVAKRRANKPVLPQAGSCRRGSPGSGPNQLKAGRASPAARQFERRRRVSLSRTHR